MVYTCRGYATTALEGEVALHELLRSACASCDSVVIVGDFNHRTVDLDPDAVSVPLSVTK